MMMNQPSWDWVLYGFATLSPMLSKRSFKLPDTLGPINILAIGYSNEDPTDPERHATQRISLNELVHYEKL